jgi:hypothetical protein
MGVAAVGPGQGGSEATSRVVVDEHPGEVVVDQRRRPRREGRRVGRDLSAEVVADQRAQLDAAKPAAALGRSGIDGSYFLLLPDLRVP